MTPEEQVAYDEGRAAARKSCSLANRPDPSDALVRHWANDAAYRATMWGGAVGRRFAGRAAGYREVLAERKAARAAARDGR